MPLIVSRMSAGRLHYHVIADRTRTESRFAADRHLRSKYEGFDTGWTRKRYFLVSNNDNLMNVIYPLSHCHGSFQPS